jgi:serine/threonine-protein kinase
VTQRILDAARRLVREYAAIRGYGEPDYLNAGASAAVFRVSTPDGLRALKVFDPAFLRGDGGEAERRRLALQRQLIDHDCPHLVQTYRVEESLGTAFVEMEFVEWPQLTPVLPQVPDEAVARLIQQLVAAVTCLEARQIVHRDIKPDNIHVAPDFSALKLLDLGVAREFTLTSAQEAAATDQDQQRPFLATAQYSSPEYLFRLSEPTESLWHALNLYQVGAVLHDLITGVPIFAEEIATGNRYVVAKSVLTKVPSFDQDDPTRLTALKSLSTRCLIKDLETRLRAVGWSDFASSSDDPLAALDEALGLKARQQVGSGRGAETVRFQRTELVRRLAEGARSGVVGIAGTRLPSRLTMLDAEGSNRPGFELVFAAQPEVEVIFRVRCAWLSAPYETTAELQAEAHFVCSSGGLPVDAPAQPIGAATIGSNEALVVEQLTAVIASTLAKSVHHLTVVEDGASLHGLNLLDGSPS